MPEKPTGQVRYLSIPYPADASPDEANAAWLAEVRRIARARGISLGGQAVMDAPGPKQARHHFRALDQPPAHPRTAPYPDEDPQTAADLVASMRELRLWAGNPSLRDLADRAGTGILPRSSISDALNHPENLPELTLLRAFVHACGGEAYWTRWFDAWRWLAASELRTGHRRRVRIHQSLAG